MTPDVFLMIRNYRRTARILVCSYCLVLAGVFAAQDMAWAALAWCIAAVAAWVLLSASGQLQ
jgi:hypothetical protein